MVSSYREYVATVTNCCWMRVFYITTALFCQTFSAYTFSSHPEQQFAEISIYPHYAFCIRLK
jgi:hypothetical protein